MFLRIGHLLLTLVLLIQCGPLCACALDHSLGCHAQHEATATDGHEHVGATCPTHDSSACAGRASTLAPAKELGAAALLPPPFPSPAAESILVARSCPLVAEARPPIALGRSLPLLI